MIYPELQWQFRLAEAEIHGDFEEFKRLTLELAALPAQGATNIFKRVRLRSAYESAVTQNASCGPELARHVLKALRALETPYDTTLYYSEQLINAGDTEEPERAYQDVVRSSKDLPLRLAGALRLATLLRSAYPDSCV